ncbi:helix-turn-helix domain-containing protein [Alkalicoccobacillus porphyridii]|nr:helix-turn-helix domain-containing protein [Alkalicoccobacillus porphyridii]
MDTMISKVWSVSQTFLRARQVHEVFDVITSAVQALVPQADMVILYKYDSTQQVLRLGSGIGIVHSSLKQIAFLPGESMTGEVFTSKKPILCFGEQDVKAKMANISADNLRWFRQGTAEKEVRYSFSVPLLAGDRCLGTLAVNCYRPGKSFCQDDVNTVIQLGMQGALALERAQYLEREAFIHKQWQHQKTIQSAFMKVLMEAGDLDRMLTVLRRLLNDAFSISFLKERTDSPYLYPISNQDKVYGWLCLSHSPTKEQENMIKQATQAIAVILGYESRNEENDLQEKEDLFTKLLETDSLRVRRQLFQSHKTPFVRALCLSTDGTISYNQLQHAVLGETSEYTIIRYRSNWYVYVKADDIDFEDLAQTLQTLHPISIGFSSIRHIDQFSLLFQEANDAVDHATGQPCVYYEQLGHKRLWSRLPDWQRQEFVQDYLRPLFLMDPMYEKTLAALIAHNRDRTKTAEALFIHPNTLYQRLKKIEHELQVSFDHDEDWINIVLSFSMK